MNAVPFMKIIKIIERLSENKGDIQQTFFHVFRIFHEIFCMTSLFPISQKSIDVDLYHLDLIGCRQIDVLLKSTTNVFPQVYN